MVKEGRIKEIIITDVYEICKQNENEKILVHRFWAKHSCLTFDYSYLWNSLPNNVDNMQFLPVNSTSRNKTYKDA